MTTTATRSSSYFTAATGVVAALLTVVGLSGVGDAPAPLEDAQLMADHFQAARADVFIGAAVGMVGIAAMVGFVAALALRLVRAGERAAGIAVGAGLAAVVGYLLALHTVYTTLSYGIAAASADVTKGMFVATILAVPVFGFGVATLLFAAALGSRRLGMMPTWWRAGTLAAGTLSTVAVLSYADAGFFSPDVQQQVVVHVLVIWLATTAATAAIHRSDLDHDAPTDAPSGATGDARMSMDGRGEAGSLIDRGSTLGSNAAGAVNDLFGRDATSCAGEVGEDAVGAAGFRFEVFGA